jgi:hypothetical protein
MVLLIDIGNALVISTDVACVPRARRLPRRRPGRPEQVSCSAERLRRWPANSRCGGAGTVCTARTPTGQGGATPAGRGPESTPADVVDSLLDQLDTVLGALRRYHGQLRSIDPARQAVETSRIRADATQQVLAAQQEAAAVAEEAVRTGDELAAERLAWQSQRSDLEGDLTAARAEAATAGEGAASARTALAEAAAAHHAELASRHAAAARAAAAHDAYVAGLAQELERTRTAAAACSARAKAADQRAAQSVEAVLGAATGFGIGRSATNAASAFSASRLVPRKARDLESFFPVSSSRPP